MKRSRVRAYILFLIVLSAGGAAALASVGGGFDLSWRTIDAGGGTSTDGDLQLSGTIGQPDAGMMTGGAFVLAGGFWGALVKPPCPWDCEAEPNGDVGIDDFLALLAQWGPCL